MKARVIEDFHDRIEFKNKLAGETIDVSKERFDELFAAGKVEALEKQEHTPVKEKKNITPTKKRERKKPGN